MAKTAAKEAGDTPGRDEFSENVKTATAMSVPDAAPPVEDDLPESVKKQLVGYAEIELENQLIDSVGAIPGLATVDKIIINLWKRHRREDLDRNKIIRTLNELAADGRLVKSESPRGYRALPAQEPSSAGE